MNTKPFHKQTPMEIATDWYGLDEVKYAIRNSGLYHSPAIPRDIDSDEFAEWLTNQCRLAMAKGIQLGRREPC